LNLDVSHDGELGLHDFLSKLTWSSLIDYVEHSHSPYGKLKLSQFSSMRKVQLRLDFNGVWYHPTLFSDMIATAALLLENLEACSSVDEIRVKLVKIVHNNYIGIQMSDFNAELCSRIDSKLARMAALRRVDFLLQNEAAVLVENLFPILKANGVLCLTQTFGTSSCDCLTTDILIYI